MYVVCPPPVTITPSGPYKAGDVLTCDADGVDLTYGWSGTNGGSSVTVPSSMVTLEEGEFCLICTATVTSVTDCSACSFLCDNATSKCGEQYNNLVTNNIDVNDTVGRLTGGLLLSQIAIMFDTRTS